MERRYKHAVFRPSLEILTALTLIREAVNCAGGRLGSSDGVWGLSFTTYCLTFSKLLNLWTSVFLFVKWKR